MKMLTKFNCKSSFFLLLLSLSAKCILATERRLRGAPQNANGCGILSLAKDPSGAAGGPDPEYNKLDVTYRDGWLDIDVYLHTLLEKAFHWLYMTGDLHNDLVVISRTGFILTRQTDRDDSYDIISGGPSTEYSVGSQQVISFRISLDQFEDIASKKMWLTSATDSPDRLPSSGNARFASCPPDPPTYCAFGSDGTDEGPHADLKSLTLRYDEEYISIKLELHQQWEVPGAHIYMNAEHLDAISFTANKFGLYRDVEEDNSFRDNKIYEGQMAFDGRTVRLVFPLELMPDIGRKNIWVRTADQIRAERLPTSGFVSFTSATAPPCPPEERGNILSNVATVDNPDGPSNYLDTGIITDEESGDSMEVLYNVTTRGRGISSLTPLRDQIEDVTCDVVIGQARVSILFNRDISSWSYSLFNSEVLVVDGNIFGSCLLDENQQFEYLSVNGYMFIDSKRQNGSNSMLVLGRSVSPFDLFETSRISIVNNIDPLERNNAGEKICLNLNYDAQTDNRLLTAEVQGSVCAIANLQRMDIDYDGQLRIDAVFSFGVEAMVSGKATLSRDLPSILDRKIRLLRRAIYGIQTKWLGGLLPDVQVGFFLEPEIVIKLQPSAAFSYESSISANLPVQTVTFQFDGQNFNTRVDGADAQVNGGVTSQSSLTGTLGVDGFIGLSPTLSGYLFTENFSFNKQIPAGVFVNAAFQVPQFPACTNNCENESPACAAAHDGEFKASVGIEKVDLSYKVDFAGTLPLSLSGSYTIFDGFSYEVVKICICCDLSSPIPCQEEKCLVTPEPTPRPTPAPIPTPRPTPPPPPPARPCSAVVTPGEGVSTEFSVEMGRTWGRFEMSFNFFDIPDRIEVFDEGGRIYDSGATPISGCHTDIDVVFDNGRSTRVDFRITSNNPDTGWEVATGCPFLSAPDIDCQEPGTPAAPSCSAYAAQDDAFDLCNCEISSVGSLAPPCSQGRVPVATAACPTGPFNNACCCRRRPTPAPTPPPPQGGGGGGGGGGPPACHTLPFDNNNYLFCNCQISSVGSIGSVCDVGMVPVSGGACAAGPSNNVCCCQRR